MYKQSYFKFDIHKDIIKNLDREFLKFFFVRKCKYLFEYLETRLRINVYSSGGLYASRNKNRFSITIFHIGIVICQTDVNIVSAHLWNLFSIAFPSQFWLILYIKFKTGILLVANKHSIIILTQKQVKNGETGLNTKVYLWCYNAIYIDISIFELRINGENLNKQKNDVCVKPAYRILTLKVFLYAKLTHIIFQIVYGKILWISLEATTIKRIAITNTKTIYFTNLLRLLHMCYICATYVPYFLIIT